MPLSNFARGQIRARFVALHTGDPGADCTAHPASDTRRMAVTWAEDANAEVLQWPLYPAAETITHVSTWDDAEAGNPWLYGPLDAPIVVAANQLLEIEAGKLMAVLE